MVKYRNPHLCIGMLAIALIPFGVDGAGIYRCIGPKGEIVFSNVGCPADHTKERIDVSNRRSSGTPVSAVEQLRQMESVNAMGRPEPRSQGARGGSAQADRQELQRIEEEIQQVEGDQAAAEAERGHGSSIRKKWNRDERKALERRKDALLRQHEAIVGGPGYAGQQQKLREMERRVKAAEEAEATARAAAASAITPQRPSERSFGPHGTMCDTINGFTQCR